MIIISIAGVFEWKVLTSVFVSVGSGVEKAIGEAVVQIDMVPGKDRKVNVRGETIRTTLLLETQTQTYSSRLLR